MSHLIGIRKNIERHLAVGPKVPFHSSCGGKTKLKQCYVFVLVSKYV